MLCPSPLAKRSQPKAKAVSVRAVERSEAVINKKRPRSAPAKKPKPGPKPKRRKGWKGWVSLEGE
jgi:hypothetical protein